MDYTYPGIFFANLLFALIFFGSVYFMWRSRKDGYWGKDSEEPKYRMLQDDDDHNEVPHGR